MSDLPTGTLTFVFTDIEGSTAMLQRLDDAYPGVLDDHNTVMRDSFATGTEISSEGDAFFYVFESAPEAIRSACVAQRGLADHVWPEGGTVLVRIGIHTGEGLLGGDNYAGLDVNRAARIAAAGHGGQILISDATRALSRPAVTSEVTLIDLGEHRLKDLEYPEHVYQVVVRGLPADFPPIASLDAAPNNLPAQATSFVGRSTEVSEVVERVAANRLVTLTGPGGSGKTRLALHVAAGLQADFQGGIFYVPLESLTNPDHVLSSIAETLGVTDAGEGPLLNAVVSAIGERRLLLVIDNFEHILDAAPAVADLLAGAPSLAVLATSQHPLRVRGEQIYPVPPLAPDDAVALFTELASGADPSFEVEGANRALVKDIVALLDRLPLALELTAPRIALFGLQGLCDRLSERLEVSAPALADLPQRHRTLRDAISWSYDLLDDELRSVFRQLGVFEGSFTLEAAEAVVETIADVTGCVASLLDRSLLRSRVRRGEVRFSMLESIRQFAVDQLARSGDRDRAARRHATYLVALAESARPLLEGEAQQVWLDRFSDELENVRAVLRFSREAGEPDLGLLVAGSIWRFFHRRGHMPEARRWIESLVKLDKASPNARATGLDGLAGIAYWQGDYSTAKTLYEELLDVYRRQGHEKRVADTLFALATTTQWLGNLEEGLAYAHEAREAYETAGLPQGAARVGGAIAWNTWRAGRLEEALELWQQARKGYAAIGDHGEVRQTDLALAAILHQVGRSEEAISLARRTVADMVEAADTSGTIMAIDFLAGVSAVSRPEEAVQLAAAAAQLRSEAGGGLTAESVDLEPVRSVASRILDGEAVEAGWKRGSGMSLDEAVALARGHPA